ncbi:MAG: ABC transporter ATP-binding protein, partial [Alphaproteobacteria bacterium]
LFPMMNVAENVAYGLRRRGLPKDQINTKVADVLDRVGLPDMASREISQLSGGQKQRIAIARCLVLDPDLLLLDEPLGALDLKLREHMKIELKKLQSVFGTTFIYITHDQSEALVMSDQVAVMNAGAFEQVGSAQDLYYNPQTAFVAGFVGDSNRWKGKVTASGRGGVKVETHSGLALVATANNAGALSKGDAVEIFVRPESVALGRDKKQISAMDNQIVGEVMGVLFNGANSRVLVRETKSGGEIDIALPQTGEFNDLTRGQEIFMGWKHDQAKCFADPGGA